MIAHEEGFEFEWQSDDFVYRVDSCHPTYLWNVSNQTDSVTNFITDAANVRRFIHRALTHPDEHTSITFDADVIRNESVDELLGLTVGTTQSNAPRIIVTYDNPFISLFTVIIEGRRIADKDETIRVLNERVKTLFDDKNSLITECDALRGRVHTLEEKFESMEEKLFHTMYKSGFPMYHTTFDTISDIKVFTRTIEGRTRYVVNGSRYANGPVDFFIDIESLLEMYLHQENKSLHIMCISIRCDETIDTSAPVIFNLPREISKLKSLCLVNLHIANDAFFENIEDIPSFHEFYITLLNCKIPTLYYNSKNIKITTN